MREYTPQEIRVIKVFFVDQLVDCMAVGLLAPLTRILDQRRELI